MYSVPGASHASVSAPPASYSSEHPQSAPGRRTPLGAVGLGGFYFQQQPQPHASSSALSDENRPDQERYHKSHDNNQFRLNEQHIC